MKRLISYFLQEWKNKDDKWRMPILLRGARQVGKTHAIRELGKKFENFLEVNLEINEEAKIIFEKDPDARRIIRDLTATFKKDITPGKTLLFIDEIQAVPKAIISLRYFKELVPELHVISAGSLLDFAIEKVGLPVGRVSSLYMYPMSFIEFLVALGYTQLAKEIVEHDINKEMSIAIHEKAMDLLSNYLAIGGMPRVVESWVELQNTRECLNIQSTIIDTYKDDFGKYAREYQAKYLNKIFDNALNQLSRKFKYSNVSQGEYRKRELEPCLDLLEKARVLNKIYYTSAQGIPIGAGSDLDDFKIIFLDVGISQTILSYDISSWFNKPLEEFINKGQIVESFVGQEILASSDPIKYLQLYYWQREARNSSAEVDYVIQLQNNIVPIEVKSGFGKTLKSMQLFLESHSNSDYGIRFSINNYSIYDPALTSDRSEHGKIHSYPLYAAAKPLIDSNDYLKKAFNYLVSSNKF